MSETQDDIHKSDAPSVLITGGNGFIGKNLTSVLLNNGYVVSHLSRNKNQTGSVKIFYWDPEKKIVDPAAFKDIDYIVHLAGANIGEKRWTGKRKEEIFKSRVNSAKLLFKTVTDQKIRLKAFITASATGYYGSATEGRVFFEDDPPSDDFTGSICNSWEKSADLFADVGIRCVKIRTGIVLGRNSAAFLKLYNPARYGIVVRVGTGSQFMPWIHITDLCNIYLKAIEYSGMEGAYNAVAPQHISHDCFIRTMANLMHRTVFLPSIPPLVLRIILGEMSDLVLKGNPVSSKKISETGYIFRYPNLDEALKEIIL